MQLLIDLVLTLIAVLLVFIASTIVFDAVHRGLHWMQGSRFAVFRAVGNLHAVHHRFLDRELRVHEELIGANLGHHVIPEYLTQVGFSLLLLIVLPLKVVAGALLIQTLVVGLILRERGLDINHRGTQKLVAYRPVFFCMPEYHALHHVYPDAHFSSWVKALDYLLATGLDLRGRRIGWLGVESEIQNALARELKRRGVVEVRHLDESQEEAPDVLLVVGDAVDPEVEAAVARHLASAKAARIPPELWWLDLGDGGRRPTRNDDVIFRRLSISGSVAPDASAKRLVGRLLRGWNFVPDHSTPRAALAFARHRKWLA